MNLPPGFTARPATPEDATSATALMLAFDRAHLEEPDDLDVSEVTAWWARLELSRDSLLVFDSGGELAACGTVDPRPPAALELDAYVHPAQRGRGLGSLMLDWGEREARSRPRPALRTAVLAADASARSLVERRGFAPVRHFYRMLIDLAAPPSEPAWPEGFVLSGFVAGEEEILHAVLEEAFEDHWGHHPRDLEDWRRNVFGRDWWDPTLVHLVRTGDEVVAAAINAVRFGMGWIGTLGTRRKWRGRGLGRGLLLTAFAELYRRGEHRIGLAVDAGNETGATQLYQSVGMRTAWQADVYEKRM